MAKKFDNLLANNWVNYLVILKKIKKECIDQDNKYKLFFLF